MSTALRETKRWTRQQYHHAATTGVFENEKVELISGEILVMSPMDAKHATGIQLILQALHAVASTDVMIRVQLPLALSVDCFMCHHLHPLHHKLTNRGAFTESTTHKNNLALTPQS